MHPGAVSRLLPPALDLAGRCTTPDGHAGALGELLDADGTVLVTTDVTDWHGWLREVPGPAVALRLRTTVRLDEPGRHEVGVGTVGKHRITVGGQVLSTSDHVVGAEVILDSSVNQPVPATLVIDVTEPTTVEVDALVQAVHPVGYASFARAELVHRVPGTSPGRAARGRRRGRRGGRPGDRGRRHQRGDRVRGVRPHEPRAARHAGPAGQGALAANPRTIVVVNAGAPVLLPWLDEVPCVLWAWLGGQEWPDALADVLTGITEPTGRLPWTLPAHESDVPVPDAVPVDGVVEYHEGVHVGYRSWLRLGRTPAAPFGHGLGWTTWEYESVAHAVEADGSVVLDVRVRNTGARDGREVVQVYVEPPGTDETRPVRWLGGFSVVHAAAGAHADVQVRVDATRVPDLGQRTARLGHPGRYLPDPRRPLLERPAPQRRRGRAQSRVGIGTARASPVRRDPQSRRTDTTSSFRISARRHS